MSNHSSSGEGYLYRGRGYIMCTGKNNYALFDKIVADDILAHPEQVSTKYALLSAGWFWSENKINAVADLGATDDVVKRITREINGADIGLKERTELFHKYYSKLTT